MRKPLALILVLALAAPVAAKTPLRDNTKINNQLLVVGLANEIRKRCGTISGRLVKGVSTLRSIHKQALSQGYSKAEIETYVESDAEKARMKQRGRVWLAQRGASPEKPETMCRVGREEIAKNSSIGALLYEK
ncbi:MAG: DUF5333 domain-containing protein [Pseudomonadota bacterium]